MGMDIHIRVAKYNSDTNLYEELVLYQKGEDYYCNEKGEKNPDFKRVYIDVGRNREMFDGMRNGDDEDYGYFPHNPIALKSLEPELRKDIEGLIKTDGFFDFWELTLADMKNYLHEYPLVTDYEVWDANYDEKNKPLKTKPLKANPIQNVYNTIYSYVSFLDWFINTENLSKYKVIIYFDW